MKAIKLRELRVYKVAFEDGRKIACLATSVNHATERAAEIRKDCYPKEDKGIVASVSVFHGLYITEQDVLNLNVALAGAEK